MGWWIWRWISSHPPPRPPLHVEYGKCRTQHERKSILYNCCSYGMSISFDSFSIETFFIYSNQTNIVLHLFCLIWISFITQSTQHEVRFFTKFFYYINKTSNVSCTLCGVVSAESKWLRCLFFFQVFFKDEHCFLIDSSINSKLKRLKFPETDRNNRNILL